jgi:TolB-like protein
LLLLAIPPGIPRRRASRPARLVALGKALHVAMVLEGTVQRDGDRLRVTARLFKVSDGFTVWADTYERQVTDVFKLQDEISKAILDAVSPELAAGGNNAASAEALPRIRG